MLSTTPFASPVFAITYPYLMFDPQVGPSNALIGKMTTSTFPRIGSLTNARQPPLKRWRT
jgi:hypothetical protein